MVPSFSYGNCPCALVSVASRCFVVLGRSQTPACRPEPVPGGRAIAPTQIMAQNSVDWTEGVRRNLKPTPVHSLSLQYSHFLYSSGYHRFTGGQPWLSKAGAEGGR